MATTPFSYNGAIKPPEFIICSVVLKPFSLGHYILLEEINSPFLTDDPNTSVNWEDGLAHFLMCLLICGQTYEEGSEMLENPEKLKSTIKDFQKSFRKSMKKEKDWNIYSKLAQFKQYIRYFTEMPIFQIESKKETVPSGIDWKQNLFTIAKNEFGYADREILNMPMKRLFYEWCSFAEKNGSIRVQNEYEMEMLQASKRG